MVPVVKNPSASAGDIRNSGSTLGLGRFPGEGHGNPLQYSCLENPRDRGAWWATAHRIAKSVHDWSDVACMHRHTENDAENTVYLLPPKLKNPWLAYNRPPPDRGRPGSPVGIPGISQHLHKLSLDPTLLQAMSSSLPSYPRVIDGRNRCYVQGAPRPPYSLTQCGVGPQSQPGQ